MTSLLYCTHDVTRHALSNGTVTTISLDKQKDISSTKYHTSSQHTLTTGW